MTNRSFIFNYLATSLLVLTLGSGTVSASTSAVKYAFSNWPPMSYVEQDELKGLFAEILNAIFVEELKMELVPDVKPWKRAQRQVELGKSDINITVATDERLGYAKRSDLPFFEMYLYAFTTASHPQFEIINSVKTVQDLIDHKLLAVTNRGNGWHAINIEGKGVKTQLVTDETDAISFLKRKRADVMIDALIATNVVIKQQGLTGVIVPTKAKFGPIKFHLLLSKKSKHISLMPKINKAFSKLKKSGAINKIISRYEKM